MAISTIGANGLAASAVTNAKIASAAGISTSKLGTGAVLQVVQGSLGTSFSGTGVVGSNYWVTVTGLSASITPSSASNKVLVYVNMYIGSTSASSGYQQEYQVLRNGTAPSGMLGSPEGGRIGVTGRINMYQNTSYVQYAMSVLSGLHMDTPASTSSLTYTVQLRGYSGSPTVYVNRGEVFQAGGSDYDGVPLSTITLVEIAG